MQLHGSERKGKRPPTPAFVGKGAGPMHLGPPEIASTMGWQRTNGTLKITTHVSQGANAWDDTNCSRGDSQSTLNELCSQKRLWRAANTSVPLFPSEFRGDYSALKAPSSHPPVLTPDGGSQNAASGSGQVPREHCVPFGSWFLYLGSNCWTMCQTNQSGLGTSEVR